MGQQRLLKCLGSIVLIVMLCVGCNHEDELPKAKVYSNDGLLGLSDVNPNLPTNPGYHTYPLDRRMVLKALESVEGVQKPTIIFNGPNLYVYLRLNKNMDEVSKARAQEAALQAVSQMMPRYRVNVIVGNSKLSNRG